MRRELLASKEKRGERALIGSIQDVVFPSGVVAHSTQALKINLQQIGGIPLLISLLEKRPAHEMIISLPIIASLIYQSPENKAEFIKLEGFKLLYRFIKADLSVLTSDTFDPLFDLLCEQPCSAISTLQTPTDNPKFVRPHRFKNLDALVLILDLTIDCCMVALREKHQRLQQQQDRSERSERSESETYYKLPATTVTVTGATQGKRANGGMKLSLSPSFPGSTRVSDSHSQEEGLIDSPVVSRLKSRDSQSHLVAALPQFTFSQQSVLSNSQNIPRQSNLLGGPYDHIRYVIQTLENLLEEYPTNAQIIAGYDARKNLVLFSILEIAMYTALLEMPTRSIKRIFEIVLPYFEQSHMVLFIDFLNGYDVDALFEGAAAPQGFGFPVESMAYRAVMATLMEQMKSSLLNATALQLVNNFAMLEQMRNYGNGEGGGFRSLLTLMKNSEESTRMCALKIIGMLLNSSKASATYFDKNSGFDILSLLLAPFPVTTPMLQALLGVSLDEYRCLGVKEQTKRWSFFGANEDKEEPAEKEAVKIERKTTGGMAATEPIAIASTPEKERAHSLRPSMSLPKDSPTESPMSMADHLLKERNRSLIVHPEAIHVLFELSKYADNEVLKTAALINVTERLLIHDENVEIIWNSCSWLDWCISFLDTTNESLSKRKSALLSGSKEDGLDSLPSSPPSSPVKERLREFSLPSQHSMLNPNTSTAINTLTQSREIKATPLKLGKDNSDSEKSCEDDSQREHSHNTLRQLGTFITKMMVYEIERKTPRFDQLMQLENEQFQGNVIDLIIRHYDRNPKIQPYHATTVIANLVALFRHMKTLTDVAPRIYVTMLDLVAKLTVHNTAEIRAVMHKEKLFEQRIEMICFLLQSYHARSEAFQHLIQAFEFQAIAGHDDFRNSYGIHFLLRIFLESHQKEYHKPIYHILRDVFGVMEENKILMKDLINDDQVFDYFFEKKRATFVRWYFLPDAQGAPLRLELLERLQRILVPLDQKLKLNIEKLVTEQRAKRTKSKSKSTKWNKTASMEQKRKRDEKNSANVIVEFQKKVRDERKGKIKQAGDVWDKCKKQFS